MTNLVVIQEEQLDLKIRQALKACLREYDQDKKNNAEDEQLFTVNQIAKRLHKSHVTIKKMVKAGLIKTTASGLITSQGINDYLLGR